MRQRFVVRAAAWLEIVVGAIFIAVPNVPCMLLFGARPEGTGVPLAHWVGVGLFALGIACLGSKPEGPYRSAVLALPVFNAGVTVLLAWVGVVSTVHGFLLWPVIILQAVITAALLAQVLAKGSVE